jgi:hypothetical protein
MSPTGYRDRVFWFQLLLGWFAVSLRPEFLGFISLDTRPQKLNFERVVHSDSIVFYILLISYYAEAAHVKASARGHFNLFVKSMLLRHIVEYLYHEVAGVAYKYEFDEKLPFLALTQVTDENGLFCSLQLLCIPLIFGPTAGGLGNFFARLFDEPWNIRLIICSDLLICIHFSIIAVSNVLAFWGLKTEQEL